MYFISSLRVKFLWNDMFHELISKFIYPHQHVMMRDNACSVIKRRISFVEHKLYWQFYCGHFD